MIWGLPPHNYMAFVILISFAAYAVILDKNGFVMTDEEGNKSTVYSHYLLLGAGISVIYAGICIMALMVLQN